MMIRFGIRRRSKTTRRKSVIKCGKCHHTARNPFRLRYHLATYHRTNSRRNDKLIRLSRCVKRSGKSYFRRRTIDGGKQSKSSPIDVESVVVAKGTNFGTALTCRNGQAEDSTEVVKTRKPRKVYTKKSKPVDPPIMLCTRQLRSSGGPGGLGALLARAKELKSRRESLQSVNETLKLRNEKSKKEKKSESPERPELKIRSVDSRREKTKAAGVNAKLKVKNTSKWRPAKTKDGITILAEDSAISTSKNSKSRRETRKNRDELTISTRENAISTSKISKSIEESPQNKYEITSSTKECAISTNKNSKLMKESPKNQNGIVLSIKESIISTSKNAMLREETAKLKDGVITSKEENPVSNSEISKSGRKVKKCRQRRLKSEDPNVKRRARKKNRDNRDLLPVPCHLCNYVGRDSYNLRRHMQSRHEPKPPKIPKIHQCEQCQYKNKYRFLVIRHSAVHSRQEGRKGNKPVGYPCDKCEYVSSSACNLKRHKFCRHEKVKEAKLQCSLCDHREPDRLALFSHFREAHGVIIETENLEFANFHSFLEFKADTERATFSRFVRQQTRTGKKKHVIFKCHRDGMFKSKSRGERKRALKTTGSNKINSACPASMRMTIDPSGKVSVVFTKTHVGHSNEVCRLTLTKEEKMLIGEMLESKRTFQEILGEIRNGLESDRLERIHLLSRKDLQNIEKWYKNREVEESPRLPIDLDVEAWVGKVHGTGVVRLYKKPKTVLSKPFKCLEYDDFVLILANDFQLAMLRHYGSECVCIDNDYDNSQVKLTSLMVVDDHRRGFPCAFMLSSKMDKVIMKVFHDVVKKASRCLMAPSLLVFDVPDYRRTEWSAVMDLPESAQVLYSPWSINDDLNRNLLKVKSAAERAEVLNMVQNLISEKSVSVIPQLIERTVKFLEENEGTELFGKYFKSKFADTAQRWSSCFRDQVPHESITGLEGVHEVVKFVYSEGLKHNKLEDCITVLMTCCRDQLQNLMVLHQRNEIQEVVNAIGQRHEAAEEMKNRSVDSGVYEIIENDLQCRCGLRCLECDVCIHTYRCTCEDSVFGWTVCQHIHFCAMNNPSNPETPALPLATSHFDPFEEKRKLLLEFENMCDDIAADEAAVGVATLVGVPVVEELPREQQKRGIEQQGFQQDAALEGLRQQQEYDLEQFSKTVLQDQGSQPTPEQHWEAQRQQACDQKLQVLQPPQSQQQQSQMPPVHLKNEADELRLAPQEQPQLADVKNKLQTRFQSICQQLSSDADLSLIEQALASMESVISSKRSLTE